MSKPSSFIPTVQRRTGVAAVGPSALRGQGKGVLKAAQTYLGTMDLSKVPKSIDATYNRWLDGHTKAMLCTLPVKTKPWGGAARKALNLFMREALYNQYLNRHYRLGKIETRLDIPLDRAAAKGLNHLAGRGKLPPWPGLKRLRKGTSDIYQAFAAECARRKGIARVHLDMYLWLENR